MWLQIRNEKYTITITKNIFTKQQAILVGMIAIGKTSDS